MQGRPATVTIGLGWFDVRGRSLVPSPPAITTAFKPASLLVAMSFGTARSSQSKAPPASPRRVYPALSSCKPSLT